MLNRIQSVFDRRLEAYSTLLPLTDVNPEERPTFLTQAERIDLEAKMAAWFYTKGSGLLLSGRAFMQFQETRKTLIDLNKDTECVRREFSPGERTIQRLAAESGVDQLPGAVPGRYVTATGHHIGSPRRCRSWPRRPADWVDRGGA